MGWEKIAQNKREMKTLNFHHFSIILFGLEPDENFEQRLNFLYMPANSLDSFLLYNPIYSHGRAGDGEALVYDKL